MSREDRFNFGILLLMAGIGVVMGVLTVYVALWIGFAWLGFCLIVGGAMVAFVNRRQ